MYLISSLPAPRLPELDREQFPAGSILRFHGRRGGFGLTAADVARGIYLPGAPRCGKTTVLCHCLQQLLPRLGPRDGLLVFDPRGDYLRRFFRPGDIVLDPNPRGQGNASWSLFADLAVCRDTRYDLEQSAALIAARLFSRNRNQLNPFFTTAPRRLLEHILLISADKPRHLPPYPNEALLNTCAGLTPQKLDALIARSSAPGELRSYLGNYSTPQALGVLGELQAAVAPLGAFRSNGRPLFSALEFARNGGGKICFLEYDAGAPDTQDLVWSLMVDLALCAALSPRPQSGRLFLCLDELPLLGSHLEMLQRALSFGAGQCIGGILCAAQSNAQLQAGCGEAEAESMLACFGIVMALRPNDSVTRRFLQQACGQVLAPVQYARCGVVSQTVQQLPALSDAQLMQMQVGDAIVVSPPHAPFAFHFAPYPA